MANHPLSHHASQFVPQRSPLMAYLMNSWGTAAHQITPKNAEPTTTVTAMTTKRSMDVVVVMDGRRVLAVRSPNGLGLPVTSLGGHHKSQVICDDVAAYTGLRLGGLRQNGVKTIAQNVDHLGTTALVDVSIWVAKVEGAGLPSVPLNDIWQVEWVDTIDQTQWSRWESVKPIFEELGLWEAASEERVVAIIFGSWVSSTGKKRPELGPVDVAVGYTGTTPPTREVMERVGHEKVRKWIDRNKYKISSSIRVHHGLQKVEAEKRVVEVEFCLPSRITMSATKVGIEENGDARGPLARLTEEETAAVQRVKVLATRAIPWAFGQRAISLSTLLFSAFTDDTLIAMWRARSTPIIVRLDHDLDPLRFEHGFDLANLRNAIRHSRAVGAFENAMRWVPWGQFITMLETKTPSSGYTQAFANAHCSGMVLLNDGVISIPNSIVVQSARIQTEAEMRAEAYSDATDPIPYHVLCQEMFKKGRWGK